VATNILSKIIHVHEPARGVHIFHKLNAEKETLLFQISKRMGASNKQGRVRILFFK
jgi:hypothetical protein